MNRQDIYKWLKSQKGYVTIEQLLHEFSEADPIEIAEGFNMYMNSQISGSDKN